MKNIYYYNIDYYCNNNCVFCFSSSTSCNLNQISLENFIKSLEQSTPTITDKVIINGGEPTIHPQFYQIINSIHMKYYTNIIIYSNGVELDITKIKKDNNILFVIPIHGNGKLHNSITQNKNSFISTLSNIKKLQYHKINYSIKFIINPEMIHTNFDINDFLNKNHLFPQEIILARLNETKKSVKNKVQLANNKEIKEYVINSFLQLRSKYKIKFLDIPFCFLDSLINKIKLVEEIPLFYFNDYRYIKVKRNYYKEIKIENKCSSCKWNYYCSLLSKTYLTLSFDKEWIIESE